MISEQYIPVRYAETDKMGVVYHANYLVWFEIGRTAFLEDLEYSYTLLEEQDLVSPVVKMEVEYGTPLKYGDTAIVKTRLVELSGVKSVFQYEIYRKGQDIQSEKPCCTGRSTHCLVNGTTFKPLSLKKLVPELYEKYEAALEPVED